MASRSKEKLLNVRRAVERVKAMLNGSAFPASLIVPPFNEAEYDQATFEAQELSKSLRASREGEDATAAPRRRALIIIFLYQMLLSEIIGWFKQQKDAAIAREAAAKNPQILDESSKLPEGIFEEKSNESNSLPQVPQETPPSQ